MRKTLPPNRPYRRVLVTAAIVAALVSAATACSSDDAGAPVTVVRTPDTTTSNPPSTPVANPSTVPSTTASTAQNPLTAGLDAIVTSHLDQNEFVGAVIAVRDSAGPDVIVTGGSKQLGKAMAVDPSIPWGIGSMTKLFVAVVTLQLAEEGKLNLDAGIDRYLPDLADAKNITPRQLLQHTSGLNEYLNLEKLRGDAKRPWSPSELVALAEGEGRVAAPGAGFHYSNTGYIVLGMIIERVTGSPWDVAVRDRITDPLQLDSTKLIVARGTPGYGFKDGVIVDQTDRWDPSVGGPAGALESTASDLLDFAQALRDGKLLKPSTTSAMKGFIPADDLSEFGVTYSYGLGLQQYVNDDVTVLGHLGSGSASSGFLGIDAKAGTIAVVLLNIEADSSNAVMAIEALTTAGRTQR